MAGSSNRQAPAVRVLAAILRYKLDIALAHWQIVKVFSQGTIHLEFARRKGIDNNLSHMETQIKLLHSPCLCGLQEQKQHGLCLGAGLH